ncbi:MAG: hypothetical protein ACXADC_01990 [Candidatus Thorarchaeota archaeon]|jgi:hypothetical protein
MYTAAFALVALGLLIVICYLMCSDTSRSRHKEATEREKPKRRYAPEREKTWTSEEEERPEPKPRTTEISRTPSVSKTTSTTAIGDFKPERMDPVLFEKLLDAMTSSAFTFEVEGWTTMELKARIEKTLKESGFTLVRSIVEDATAERVEVKMGGWTRQVSTDKGLGVRITLKGVPDRDKAFCHMTVSAEDRSLVLPTINKLRKKIIS